MDIQTLIKNRREFIDAQIKNGFDLTTVLVGLYSDPSHFIFEILQNAEDAKATEVSFQLTNSSIVINHNGVPFNEHDIEAITGISNLANDKKNNLEKIGKFGIGFKSVYALTDRPRIQSGIYDFEIVKFILPENFKTVNEQKTTTITLPLDPNKTDIRQNLRRVVTKFEIFEPFNILFLKNIKKVTLEWLGKKKEISKNEEILHQVNNVQFINTTVKHGSGLAYYFVFRAPVGHNDFNRLTNKPFCAVAFNYSIEDGKIVFRKPNSNKVFAFFQTEFVSYLDFLIQAPFSTTPARDNIDFEQDINKSLLNELTCILDNALEYFSTKQLIDVNFLQLLPIDPDSCSNNVVIQVFYDHVLDKFQIGQRLLPVENSKSYQSANEVALLRGRELISMVSEQEDLRSLFGVKFWLLSDITSDKTPHLFNYLQNELNIKVYDSDSFARRLNTIFLRTKDESWFIKLYRFLNGRQESLYSKGRIRSQSGPIRYKPIILLENGELAEPFDEDENLNVFLPVEGRSMVEYTVKSSLLEDDEAKEFLVSKLGLTKPDLISQIIHRILPKLLGAEHIHPKTMDRYVNKLDAAYKSNPTRFENEVSPLIRETNTKFIKCKKPNGSEIKYAHPSSIYLMTQDLLFFFQNTNEVLFLAFEEYGESSEDFFVCIGVRTSPAVRDFVPKLSSQQKEQIRFNHSGSENITYDISIRDYSIDGLLAFLEKRSFNLEDSLFVWKLLIELMEFNENFFRGTYSWMYHGTKVAMFPSQLTNTLMSHAWLFDKEGNQCKPSNVLRSNLNEKYPLDTDEAGELMEALELISDEQAQFINSLPIEYQDDFNLFLQFKKMTEANHIDIKDFLEQQNETMESQLILNEIANAPNIEDVSVVIEDFEENNVLTFEIGVSNKEDIAPIAEVEDTTNLVVKQSKKYSAKVKQSIGQRAEILVFRHLCGRLKELYSPTFEDEDECVFEDEEKNEYVLKLLNSYDEQGIGCDILLTKNDEHFEYFEVKGSIEASKSLFPLSGYQWNAARKVYEEGNGNMYSICVVKDVLNSPKIITIKNPIKKWKDGLLKVHPVNIEI